MRRLFANLARCVPALVCPCVVLCVSVRRAVGAAAGAAAGTAVTAGRSLPDTRPTSGTEEPASVSEPPQRGDASVASRAWGVSRTSRRLRQFRLRRRPRRPLLPVPLPLQRHGDEQSDGCHRPAPGRAGREQDRRPNRHALHGIVRPAAGVRGRECHERGQDPDRGAARPSGNRVRRPAPRRPRQLDQLGPHVRRRASDRQVQARADRSVRGVSRSHSRRRVRQERQRQPLRRRVREQRPDPAPGDSRAVPVLAARHQPARRNGPARLAAAGDDRCPAGGKAARATRLQRGDGRPARLPRARFGARLGRTLADPRDAEGLQDAHT